MAVTGPTFIIDEDFEGTGTPPGWWAGGSDYGATTSPISGAKSGRPVSGSQILINEASYLEHTELWFKWRMRYDAAPATFQHMMQCGNDNFQTQAGLTMNANGTITAQDSGVGIFITTVAAMTVGQTYYCWFYRKANTGGNNGIVNFGFSLADVKPTSGDNFVGASTGVTVDPIYTASWSAGNSFLQTVDEVQIAAEEFS